MCVNHTHKAVLDLGHMLVACVQSVAGVMMTDSQTQRFQDHHIHDLAESTLYC